MKTFRDIFNEEFTSKDFVTPVYHGTPNPGFEKFRTDPSVYMPDRGLGVHVAKDPAIASTFTKDTGGVYPLKIPHESKFKEIDQPLLPYVKPGTPKTSSNVRTDQTEISHDMYHHAYPEHPEMLANHLHKMYNGSINPDQSQEMANNLISGKPVANPLHPETKYTGVKDFLRRAGSLSHYATEDERSKITNTYKDKLTKQGYAGIKYINTSPMETEHAKDPTCFVVFNPDHIKSRFQNESLTFRRVFAS